MLLPQSEAEWDALRVQLREQATVVATSADAIAEIVSVALDQQHPHSLPALKCLYNIIYLHPPERSHLHRNNNLHVLVDRLRLHSQIDDVDQLIMVVLRMLFVAASDADPAYADALIQYDNTVQYLASLASSEQAASSIYFNDIYRVASALTIRSSLAKSLIHQRMQPLTIATVTYLNHYATTIDDNANNIESAWSRCRHIFEFLMNIDPPHETNFTPISDTYHDAWFPPSPPSSSTKGDGVRVLDKFLADMLSHLLLHEPLHSLPTPEMDQRAQPILILLSSLSRANFTSRLFFRSHFLPESMSRSLPLHTGTHLYNHFIRAISPSPSLPSFSTTTSSCFADFAFVMSGENPDEFVRNVGLGSGIGYLTARNLMTGLHGKGTVEVNEKVVDIVTGQEWVDKKVEFASEEEKERETSKLVAALEKMERTGMVKADLGFHTKEVQEKIEEAVEREDAEQERREEEEEKKILEEHAKWKANK